MSLKECTKDVVGNALSMLQAWALAMPKGMSKKMPTPLHSTKYPLTPAGGAQIWAQKRFKEGLPPSLRSVALDNPCRTSTSIPDPMRVHEPTTDRARGVEAVAR